MNGIWLKLTADHGGGHQGHDVEYVYIPEDYLEDDGTVSEITKRQYWDWWVDSERFNNVQGDAEVVKTVPKDVIKEMIREEKSSIKSARAMLKILAETPTDE